MFDKVPLLPLMQREEPNVAVHLLVYEKPPKNHKDVSAEFTVCS